MPTTVSYSDGGIMNKILTKVLSNLFSKYYETNLISIKTNSAVNNDLFKKTRIQVLDIFNFISFIIFYYYTAT